MIYIDNRALDPFYHFGLEYYLISEKRMEQPVFMLWRNEPALMVGKYQNTLEEINDSVARRLGVQVVRRMSGGGTIYTDMGGWQFTFITPGKAGQIDFAAYIAPVVGGLRALGLAADFNGRNDLLVEGKKVSGNAQYMHAGYTLHHGSLLFDTDIEQMVKCTTVDNQKIVSKGIASVRERVTNIAWHLPHPMGAEDFREIMVDSIAGKNRQEYILTPEDIARAEALADEKFRPRECVYGASPKCNLTREGRFAGGKIVFKLDIQKGRIAGCRVYGDFFSSLDIDVLSASLIGCPYEKGAVQAVLQRVGQADGLYRIERDQLIGCIVD